MQHIVAVNVISCDNARRVDAIDGTRLGALARQFAPELDKLKGLAVGAVVGLIRDMVKQSLPDELGGRLSEVLDDTTHRANVLMAFNPN